MITHLTFMDTISLSCIVFVKTPVKILMAAQNGGLWPFRDQGHKSIFYSIKRHLLSPNGVVWDIAQKNRYSRSGCTRVQERRNFKRKKHKPLYFGYMYLSPREFFRNQILLEGSDWGRDQSCQTIFNRFTRVSLARGQTSSFSVQTVDGHYNYCCTAVQLWYFCWTSIL